LHYLPTNIYDKIGRVIKSFIWDEMCLNRMRNRAKWSAVFSLNFLEVSLLELSGMITKIGIRFENCRFQQMCIISVGFAWIMQSQLKSS